MKEKNIKIAMLEVQNVKRIKAVRVDCTGKSLTVIGGNNEQGKTSVIDSIAYVLGGARYRPSTVKRDGAAGDPVMKITMDNGLIVERKGKNSDLKITDPNGGKSGQQLLNEFVSQLAIDLPKFLSATDAEKAHILLDNLGIEEDLKKLEGEETRLYNERHTVGRIADQKKKYAAEMPVHEDVPDEPLSISTLIKEQQEILAKNGENKRLRDGLEKLQEEEKALLQKKHDLMKQLADTNDALDTLAGRIATGKKTVETLNDESTEELEANIANTEVLNNKIRANLERAKAEMEAEAQDDEYKALSDAIDAIRDQRIKLLSSVEFPLEGLSIEDGKLTYKGKFWDCMSGSEQLRVGTAIAQKINPKCGFVLVDSSEQFDAKQLAEFGGWLDENDLQAICTRVSTGDECSIIIEDGFVVGQETFLTDEQPGTTWTPGEF